jgi:hypothetical protein
MQHAFSKHTLKSSNCADEIPASSSGADVGKIVHVIRTENHRTRFFILAISAAVVCSYPAAGAEYILRTLVNFNVTNGAGPDANLIADSNCASASTLARLEFRYFGQTKIEFF